MKKVLLIFHMLVGVILLNSNKCSGQGISVEVGYNALMAEDWLGTIYGSGQGAYLIPRINLSDKFSAGISLSLGTLKGDLQNSQLPGAVITEGSITNIGASLQYKILDKKISPYLELGIGSYSLKQGEVNGASAEYEDISEFGASPKIGLMLWGANVFAAYHAGEDITYMQYGIGYRFGVK